MDNKTSISILGITSLLLLAFLFFNEGDGKKNIYKTQILSESNFVGYGVDTNIYDANGNIKYKAKAQIVRYIGVDYSYNFTDPKITLFVAGSPIWKLQARHALLNKDNKLSLKNDIIATNLIAERKINWIKTNEIDVNLNNYNIKTNADVIINGMGFNTTGLGLTGNLFKQIANLKQKVKTVYEINTIN